MKEAVSYGFRKAVLARALRPSSKDVLRTSPPHSPAPGRCLKKLEKKNLAGGLTGSNILRSGGLDDSKALLNALQLPLKSLEPALVACLQPTAETSEHCWR